MDAAITAGPRPEASLFRGADSARESRRAAARRERAGFAAQHPSGTSCFGSEPLIPGRNSSVGYYIAAPNSTAYGASKAGMMALTRGMALELAPFDIRVNAVCPGVIDTPMNERNAMRSADPEAMRRSWFEITPLGRLGQPEDVAFAMLFLACDESSFITGTPLLIDGGRTAH